MIRLYLLLLGAEIVRRRWQSLAILGALWLFVGQFIFLDSLDNDSLIPVYGFGWFLLLEGAVTLLSASGTAGTARRLRMFKAVVVIVIGLLMVDHAFRSDIVLALVIGTVFAVDGALKVAAARIVRFPGWRMAQVAGVVMLLLAVATLQPWPTWYVGTIGCNVGLLLSLSGIKVLYLAYRLRRLPHDAPLSLLMSPQFAGWTVPSMEGSGRRDGSELVLHVWTPTGSVEQGQRRPIVDRYIAAVDQRGVISTGHAALELAPDLYISHYPAEELERPTSDFGKVLRATQDKDVPGRFLPSYREEADGWCESTMHVAFRTFDAVRLRAFWAAYQRDDTYNLTRRNCSSAVAHALDAALEGVLTQQAPRLPGLLRPMVSPELWVASLLRSRAETMAWTPGLVLDYARALSGVINPPAAGWLQRVLAVVKGRRGVAGTGCRSDGSAA